MKSRISLYLATVLTLGGVLVLCRMIQPDALPRLCLFEFVTGIPCMFCGLTHAFHAIAIGHVQDALRYHPLSLVAFGLVILHLIMACVRLLDGENKLHRTKLTPLQMTWATFGLFTLVWVGRLLMGTL